MASLKADEGAEFSIVGEDEMHNPVPLTGGTAAFAVDRPDILTLTDNGDGTGKADPTGQLGTAVLSVDGTTDTGLVYRGSLAIDVVPGDVATVNIVLGPPAEVTPDT